MNKHAVRLDIQPDIQAIVDHGLGTRDVVVQLFDRDGRSVTADVVRLDNNLVGITTDHRDELHVVVMG